MTPSAPPNFLIAQSGGPTTVINASLEAAVKRAIEKLPTQAKVLGARYGVRGILDENFVDLRQVDQDTWKELGTAPGAALGASRFDLDNNDFAAAVRTLRRHEVSQLAYIGGNGSMATAARLEQVAKDQGFDLRVAGIPKTIDNDIPGTDVCPGFASCARYFAQSVLDLAADVRCLPTPVSILEVMGRNSGWLAAATVLARGPDQDAPHHIYLPEVPLSPEQFLDDVQRGFDQRGWVVVTVAEGVGDEAGNCPAPPFDDPAAAAHGGKMLGDVAAALARLVTGRLGLRARCEKPGLLGRAAAHAASPVDRQMAQDAARHAVEKLVRGESGFMTAVRIVSSNPLQLDYESVPFETVCGPLRRLPHDFLHSETHQPNEVFCEYVKPLIGGPLRRYANLLG